MHFESDLLHTKSTSANQENFKKINSWLLPPPLYLPSYLSMCPAFDNLHYVENGEKLAMILLVKILNQLFLSVMR